MEERPGFSDALRRINELGPLIAQRKEQLLAKLAPMVVSAKVELHLGTLTTKAVVLVMQDGKKLVLKPHGFNVVDNLGIFDPGLAELEKERNALGKKYNILP